MTTIDWIGSIGVFQILLAYILNLFGNVKTTHLSFILLNLSGATMACLASVLLKYLPFILLEGVWAIVSLTSLIQHIKTKNSAS